MTEKLFYRDSMIKEFQAKVVSCSPLSEEEYTNRGINYEVVLDRTAFFPVNVETVMQIVDKAFKMGILDNDSLNDMKEIVAAMLTAKDK